MNSLSDNVTDACYPDRVLGAAQGAFGEVVAADWRSCIPVPKEMTWEQASGIYV